MPSLVATAAPRSHAGMHARRAAVLLPCLLGSLRLAAQTPSADDFALERFDGDRAPWSAAAGVLIGRLEPAGAQTGLRWRGDDVGDFELRFEARVHGDGRCSVLYRRRGDGGYRCDLDAGQLQAGQLGDAGGAVLALRGEQVLCGDESRRPQVLLGSTVPAPRGGDGWHEYVLRACGNRCTHAIDGTPVAELVDLRSGAPLQGGLRLRLQAPCTVELRNLRLLRLSAAAAAGPRTAARIWNGERDRGDSEVWMRRSFELRLPMQ